MAVTVLTQASPSAPTLNGNSGSLVSVLDFCLVTTMGWSKVYTGTNKAVYRAPSGNRFYLRVDDTGGQNARLVGYETMSDVDTGTGAFPTTAQVSGGLYLYKSSTGDATARPWIFAGNDRFFHLFTSNNSAASAWGTSGARLTSFGDYTSYKSGDAYNTLIMGDTAASGSTEAGLNGNRVNSGSITATPGHYSPRSYTQLGTSVAMGKFTDSARSQSSSASTIGDSGLTYPTPIDGALLMAPIWLNQTQGPRGILPGLWGPLHSRPLTHDDTFSGVSGLSGRSFRAINIGAGQAFLETSDTWD